MGLRAAFQTNGRVLLALMLREARTRYGRRRAGYLWALVEPMMHIAVFYLIFSYMGRVVALGDSLLAFLATGFATFIGWRNVQGRTAGGYGSNQALLSFPIVRLIDVFIGRGLLEVATWIAVTLILFGGLYLMGEGGVPPRPLLMLASILALSCIGIGMGTVIGLISEFVPSLGTILTIPQRFLYFASGIFYLPESMPPVARDIILWIPLTHGVTLFRMGYYDFYDGPTFDGPYLVYWAVGSLLAAFVAERIARRPIRNLA